MKRSAICWNKSLLNLLLNVCLVQKWNSTICSEDCQQLYCLLKVFYFFLLLVALIPMFVPQSHLNMSFRLILGSTVIQSIWEEEPGTPWISLSGGRKDVTKTDLGSVSHLQAIYPWCPVSDIAKHILLIINYEISV